MTKTLQVTATLIPVGQKIHAEPGQMLMVVAGVCIGVYTGSQRAEPAAVVAPTPTVAQPQSKPAQVAKRSAGKPLGHLVNKDPNREPRPHPSIGATQLAIKNYLKAHGPTKSRVMLKEWGYSRGGSWNWQFRDAISQLKRAGEVTVDYDGRDAIYSLKQSNSQAA